MKRLRPPILLVFYFMEIWKDIKGYEGYYQVSNLGRVKSLQRVVKRGNGYLTVNGKLLKPAPNSRGYMQLVLHKDGFFKSMTVHSLVAVAFLGYERGNKGKIVVDHIDNNRLNNSLDNLQIISHRLNCSKDVKNKTSKYTGVRFKKKQGKWESNIHVGNKQFYLGVYDSEYKAHLKYQEALKNLTNGILPSHQS